MTDDDLRQLLARLDALRAAMCGSDHMRQTLEERDQARAEVERLRRNRP